MKQICFILDWYPTKTNNGCIFAKYLICAIADQGFDCVVIAPKIKFIQKSYTPYKRIEETENGNKISIYTPSYIHLGSYRRTMKMSMNNHYKAVMRVIKNEDLHPDVVYGHFIYQCGLTAARIGKKLSIPAYCACGENSLRLMKGSIPYAIGLKHCNWQEILNSLSGIISVSEYNKYLLQNNRYISQTFPIGVFPNGINRHKFYPINKSDVRKKLGLPGDAFIIAFTGSFKESKGVLELSEALNQLNDVYSLFMGKGYLMPKCKNILFCGSVPNDELVMYLNAADLFVLPTKGEGCCNAIVEALACGLPVISSNLPFNDDILSDINSLRIDVDNLQQLVDSIIRLKEDIMLRERLSTGALYSVKALDINERAQNILKFMRLL